MIDQPAELIEAKKSVDDIKLIAEWSTITAEMALQLMQVWTSGQYPDDDSVVERVSIMFPRLDHRHGMLFIKENKRSPSWEKQRMDNVVNNYKIDGVIKSEAGQRLGFVERNILNPMEELLAARVRGLMIESSQDDIDLKEAGKILNMTEKIAKMRKPKAASSTGLIVNPGKGRTTIKIGGEEESNPVEVEIEEVESNDGLNPIS